MVLVCFLSEQRCQANNAISTSILLTKHTSIRCTRGDIGRCQKGSFRQLDQEQRAILEWHTLINYASQQSDIISSCQQGTGHWLLTSKEFQKWVSQGKKTLSCPGIPGAGKTMMSSIVIDHLSAKIGNDAGIGISYIYCNYQRQQEQTPTGLLSRMGMTSTLKIAILRRCCHML